MLLLKRKIRNAYFEMRQTPKGMYEEEYYYLDIYVLTKDNKQVKETICKRLLIKALSQSVDYLLLDKLLLRLTKIQGLHLSQTREKTITGTANFELLEKE